MGWFDGVQRARRKNFMEAVSAACAMVAFADGIVRPEEMAKLIEYLRIDEALQVFDPVEVIGAFERYVEILSFDAAIGREKAFGAMAKIEPRSEEAKLIILIACAVGSADEDFNNDQRLMVRQLCARVGFDPREFDLNLRAPSPDIRPAVPKIRRQDVNMPDWMRHPPPGKKPAAAKTDPAGRGRSRTSHGSIPEWMRKAPETPPPKASSPGKDDTRSLPEWMRTPPDPKNRPPAGDDPDADIPDWMKKA